MRLANKAPRALPALAALSLGTIGCSGFDRLDVTYLSAPVDSGTVSYDGIRIHEGTAVGFVATPIDGDEPMERETVIKLEPEDLGVLQIAPSQPKDPLEEGEANWTFVVVGISPGATYVDVRVDGDVEGRIPAIVEAQ